MKEGVFYQYESFKTTDCGILTCRDEYGEDASTEARFHYMSTQTNTYIMFTTKSDTATLELEDQK